MAAQADGPVVGQEHTRRMEKTPGIHVGRCPHTSGPRGLRRQDCGGVGKTCGIGVTETLEAIKKSGGFKVCFLHAP